MKPTEHTENGQSFSANGQNTMEQRLATLEALLQEQRDLAKKGNRFRTVQALLMLCLVVVFTAGTFLLNQTVTAATQDLPVLIESTTLAVEQVRVTMEEIAEIDYDSMNQAVEGIGSVDYESLNRSIRDLEEVVRSLEKFLNPFG